MHSELRHYKCCRTSACLLGLVATHGSEILMPLKIWVQRKLQSFFAFRGICRELWASLCGGSWGAPACCVCK